jgi:hypothetical protein
MTLSSKIIGTQELHAGDTVGYGSRFQCDGPLRLGVVACGYADGYPRVCPTGTPVLVDGVRTRTLGRVSMDMMAVDLSPVPKARLGSEVTLWGRASNGAVLPIDEVAAARHAGLRADVRRGSPRAQAGGGCGQIRPPASRSQAAAWQRLLRARQARARRRGGWRHCPGTGWQL